MPGAELVAPHIASLRRFSRVMHGSQNVGDHHVAECLRTMVDEPSGRDFAEEAPVALFRHYLSRSAPPCDVNSPADFPSESAIGVLSRDARSAFLLTALERFSIAQTASILNVDAADVDLLLEEAGGHLANQTGAEVLIVEDEPLIAMDIEGLLEEFGHEVVGVARTRREAVMLARKMGPGLVLADIQLADGSSGIDAVADIRTTLDVPVIFLTAFPQRLLTGEAEEPAFLVTKPFNPDALRAMLSQVLFCHQPSSGGAQNEPGTLAG